METTVLNDIPFEIDNTQLLNNLHIKDGTYPAAQVKDLVDIAMSIGKPKAIYKEVYVESNDDNSVIIDGIEFVSRVLRVNLDKVFKVFPFVITSGNELEEWSKTFDDLFLKLSIDIIKEMVLNSARENVRKEIDEKYNLPKASDMNPGSLADWPLKEQKQLFTLLGNVKESIGVELGENFFMIPVKTVSGIRFPVDVTYVNCLLCPREGCSGRIAPYDENLYNEKYKVIK